MEIGTPTWNSGSQSYSFRILKSSHTLDQLLYCEEPVQKLDLPASPVQTYLTAFVPSFLDQTKKYFTNPLTYDKVVRHLRHTASPEGFPQKAGWYKVHWQPFSLTIKANDFHLLWQISGFEEAEVVIPPEFTTSTTPRAQSPLPEQTRNIQIHDSLIPVGDLPLSDLPPLSFETEQVDPSKEEIKRRIREARLKLQLAKLKAERMEHKYFKRYGQEIEDSEDSSEFSSDSEEEQETSF
jgi:hypothetical protein